MRKRLLKNFRKKKKNEGKNNININKIYYNNIFIHIFIDSNFKNCEKDDRNVTFAATTRVQGTQGVIRVRPPSPIDDYYGTITIKLLYIILILRCHRKRFLISVKFCRYSKKLTETFYDI